MMKMLTRQVRAYLASHPDESRRLARLSTIVAAREIGHIERKLKPKPRPVEIRGHPAEMTNAEYRAWREASGGVR